MNISETKVIYDLTQKTRQEKMVWTRQDEVEMQNFSNSRTIEAYSVEYNGERLELFVESRVDEEYDTNVHRTLTHLYILGDNGEHLWKFPDNDAIDDLLSSVQVHTRKVGNRLKKLLEG